MYYEHAVQAIGLEGSRWPGMYPYRFEILSPKPTPLDPKIKIVQHLKDAREIQISGWLMPVVKGFIVITKEEIHEVQQRNITNLRPRDTILAAWSTFWTRDPKPAQIGSVITSLAIYESVDHVQATQHSAPPQLIVRGPFENRGDPRMETKQIYALWVANDAPQMVNGGGNLPGIFGSRPSLLQSTECFALFVQRREDRYVRVGMGSIMDPSDLKAINEYAKKETLVLA